MVETPTIAEVEAGYHGNPVQDGDLPSSGDFDNPDQAEILIEEAVSMFENVFSDQVLFTSETRDENTAIRYLARHKWCIALGESQSEGQAGTNVTWNVGSATERGLSRTTYGQEFVEYLRSEPNISVFQTR